MRVKYFKSSEFDCKCGCGLNNIDRDLVQKLDMARNLAGIPFMINSACRCKNHNENVGGSSSSSHISGYAVDIRVRFSSERHKILVALLGVGFNRVGIYKKFIHVDVDYTKQSNVVWYV